jgi:hypothetical protein
MSKIQRLVQRKLDLPNWTADILEEKNPYPPCLTENQPCRPLEKDASQFTDNQ